MKTLLHAVPSIAACGMLLALAEMLLPRSGVRTAARAALGILFLEILIGQILGIIP